jgi:hypothetical protein
MKREEFTRFQEAFLFPRFPELEAWLNNQGEDRRAETVESWWEVLRYAELIHAQEAVRRMHAGDEPEPRSFSRFPAAILAVARNVAKEAHRRAASRPGPRVVDGEPVYQCLQCEDFGMIAAWHPDTLKELAAGERGTLYTCVFACTCPAGTLYRKWAPVFDAERHLPLRRRDADGQWRMHYQHDAAEIETAREFAERLYRQREEQQAIPF